MTKFVFEIVNHYLSKVTPANFSSLILKELDQLLDLFGILEPWR
jgi:hypothetical protein